MGDAYMMPPKSLRESPMGPVILVLQQIRQCGCMGAGKHANDPTDIGQDSLNLHDTFMMPTSPYMMPNDAYITLHDPT
eukprot:gene1233-871_t